MRNNGRKYMKLLNLHKKPEILNFGDNENPLLHGFFK